MKRRLLFVVVLAPVLVFWPVLEGGFLDWDDDALLLNNPHLSGFSLDNIRWAFTTFRLGHYMPLTWLTYLADHAAWGQNPAGYHLTSLLLHAANAGLFFIVFRRLLERAAPEILDGFADGKTLAAAGAALFFSLHPLRAESAAWLTERRGLLAAFFLLLSLRAYLAEEPAPRRLPLSLGFFALSLLSKGIGMVWPAVLLALDVYPLRRLGTTAIGWSSPAARRTWKEKIPFFALALAAAATAAVSAIHAGAAAPLGKLPLPARAGQAAHGAWFLLGKTLIPAGLSPLYEIPSAALRPAYVLSLVALVTATVVLIRGRSRAPALLSAWAIHLLFLAPTSGILQSGPQFTADRYTYLGGMGWAALSGMLPLWAWRQRGPLRVLSAALPALLLAFVPLSRTQARVWKDTASLWNRVLRVDPDSPVAHYNLGCNMMDRGEGRAALDHFQRAAALRPAYAEPYQNMGYLALLAGKDDEALRLFQRALRLKSELPESHNNMGLIFWRRGETKRARLHYEEALRLAPDFAEAHNNLAIVLTSAGDPASAIAHAEESVRLDPDSAQAHFNLALIRARLGDQARAAEHFRRAAALDPDLQVPPGSPAK